MVQLGDDEVREHYRLACQCEATNDLTVQISPALKEAAFNILVDTGEPAGDGRLALDCGVRKLHVKPAAPEKENHQTSDLEQIAAVTGHGFSPGISIEEIRRVPTLLRSDAGMTVTSAGDSIIALEAGDTSRECCGIALDIGTTTVVGYLIDLASGATLATVSGLNPQTVYGGDLMSRIAFAMDDPGNTRKLRSKIVHYANELIGEACDQADVGREHIYRVVVVGNTCMHHLLLGIDPTFVGQAPHAPVLRPGYEVTARGAGLRVNVGAALFMLPIIAGFVGADTVGMILASRLESYDGIRIAADIGTNAEMVISVGGSLLACSSPAGPALEGAQIRCGMRAATGAIDRLWIDDDVRVRTIGNEPAVGICGSGLIDAVAALLNAGFLDPSGRLRPDAIRAAGNRLAARARADRDDIQEFVLVWAPESGVGRDIVLSQADIRQLQLAKAAIVSGIILLQQIRNVDNDDVSELLLSGAFGNYVDIASVRRIGMIPDFPVSRVRYVANAAGLGAQMALVSETERCRAETLARQVEHVSLASHPDFQQIFVDATRFPTAVSE